MTPLIEKVLNKRKVLKSHITHETNETVLKVIADLARRNVSSYVCLTNIHMVVEACRNPQFNEVVNSATLAVPDGKPLAIAMNLLYGIKQQQIAGMDLLLDLLEKAEQERLSVFFWAQPKTFCRASS